LQCAGDLEVNVLQVASITSAGFLFDTDFDLKILSDDDHLFKNSGVEIDFKKMVAEVPQPLIDDAYNNMLNVDLLTATYHVQRMVHASNLLPDTVNKATIHVPAVAYVFGGKDSASMYEGEMTGFDLDLASQVSSFSYCTCNDR
jgi:hypothetical protein